MLMDKGKKEKSFVKIKTKVWDNLQQAACDKVYVEEFFEY